AVVLGALGIASWRHRHRASVAQSLLGLGACALAGYTAYLGGEMVYEHGLGVDAVPGAERERRATPLLSRAAPRVLLRDALQGLVWLFGRAQRIARGRQRVGRGAFGVVRELPRP